MQNIPLKFFILGHNSTTWDLHWAPWIWGRFWFPFKEEWGRTISRSGIFYPEESVQTLDERCCSRAPRCEFLVLKHATVCLLLSAYGTSVCSTCDIFICPKVDPKSPRPCSMELVELEEHDGSKPACGSPSGVEWRILWRSVEGALLWFPGCMWLTMICELFHLP